MNMQLSVFSHCNYVVQGYVVLVYVIQYTFSASSCSVTGCGSIVTHRWILCDCAGPQRGRGGPGRGFGRGMGTEAAAVGCRDGVAPVLTGGTHTEK